jgi:hypothetical protein
MTNLPSPVSKAIENFGSLLSPPEPGVRLSPFGLRKLSPSWQSSSVYFSYPYSLG